MPQLLSPKFIRCFLSLVLLPTIALGTPDNEWAVIVAMDAGPGKKPGTPKEAQMLARAHLNSQKRLIKEFLAKYPNDSRIFDAKLRLAAILATTGKMDNVQERVDEAMRLLTRLEKSPDVSSEKRADAGFRRASLYLQSMRGRENEMRSSIVDCARNFMATHPGDRRGPRLLVEVATVCDDEPKLKRQLLKQAQELSSEDQALQRRIADDLKRLEHLGKPLPLKFSTLQGATFDMAAEKDHVVLLVFWSAESLPSLLWLRNFHHNVEQLPKSNLRIATVSLDTNRKAVGQRLKEFHMEDQPAYFDGKGWDNLIARPLGINSLPTVFVIDKRGILRALNASNNYNLWVRRLLRE